MVVDMNKARLRVGLVKAADTARRLAGIVQCPSLRANLQERAERLSQRARNLV